MYVYPLVAAVLALLAGILPGLRFGGPVLFMAAAALVCVAAAAYIGDRARAAALLLAFGSAGAALGSAAAGEASADCRARFAEGEPLRAVGALAANLPAATDGDRPAVPVRLIAVASERGTLLGCAGEARVRFPRDAPALRAGTEVRLRGVWQRSSGPAVRTAWPEDPVFAGMLRAEAVSPTAAPSWGRHPLLKLRGAASARLDALFPRHAALANALLLGRRETLDPAIRERFARAGLVHLLAISGTHVGILAGIVLLLGRAFGVGRRTLAWSSMALLAVYLALIGAPPSAVRAGVMLALALLGLALQRPASPFPVVAAAAGVLLVADPLVALNPGFQLSFAGVLGILLLRRALLRVVPTAWRRRALPRYTIDLAAASVAAFAATAPIAAYHFGQIAPVALFANLPAVPLTGVALACIAGAALTDPVLPPLAHAFAWFGDHALGMLDVVATRAADAPLAGMGIARPGWGWIVVALLGGCFVLEAARRMRGPIRWGAAAALALAVLLAMPGVAAAPGRALELHFIDVGQGDAVAIRTPAGRWLLIDAGPRTDRFDAGRSRVLPFLRAHGAERLEALVLTHPDGDHIGGASAVLDGISVRRLVEPGQAVGKPLYLATLREAEERGVPWTAARAGRTLRMDGVELEVLAPTERLVEEATESNEVSMVTLLRYGSFRALLTGDLPDDGEQRLVASHPDLHVQVLKAGHHGSRTSTSAALLEATRPEVVVITVGRRNRYGHPAPSTLQRIRQRGIPILRTDLEGTVSLRAQEDGSWKRWGRDDEASYPLTASARLGGGSDACGRSGNLRPW